MTEKKKEGIDFIKDRIVELIKKVEDNNVNEAYMIAFNIGINADLEDLEKQAQEKDIKILEDLWDNRIVLNDYQHSIDGVFIDFRDIEKAIAKIKDGGEELEIKED